jgi:hypothetical protein
MRIPFNDTTQQNTTKKNPAQYSKTQQNTTQNPSKVSETVYFFR